MGRRGKKNPAGSVEKVFCRLSKMVAPLQMRKKDNRLSVYAVVRAFVRRLARIAASKRTMMA
jgi:hypothetical protein